MINNALLKNGVFMKIIFSRKGFDSGIGGVASPIFPSGELQTLPIPESVPSHHSKRYKEIQAGGLSYHGDKSRWARDGDAVLLRTVGRGQEFVLDCQEYPEAIQWLCHLLCLSDTPRQTESLLPQIKSSL
jgi:Nucleotide modification associated domain 3